MTIFDKERMKQKIIYPTKQTPSYADWALFEMGKELEESGSGGTAYTAGSGIAISEENVISNIAQPDVTKAYVDSVDVNLQQQIDAIVASSDVKDIVGTYAQLQAYDTTTLGNNDIIKVLVDSTHNDAMGYYRWIITEGVGAWSYIGSEGPYYTKSQDDVLLQGKVNTNLDNVNVGSATAGQVVKVNSSANGVEFGDVPKELPSIASGDAGKVLQVNSGETGVEWDSVNEVPNPTASDVNKVLTATAANAFAWMAAGGGGSSQWNDVYSRMDLSTNDIFVGRIVTDDPDSQFFTNYVIGIVGSADATIISFSNCICVDSDGNPISGTYQFEGYSTYFVTGIKYRVN